MKRILIIAAVIIFIAGFLASCNNYVCPAYAKDNVEHADNADNS